MSDYQTLQAQVDLARINRESLREKHDEAQRSFLRRAITGGAFFLVALLSLGVKTCADRDFAQTNACRAAGGNIVTIAGTSSGCYKATHGYEAVVVP